MEETQTHYPPYQPPPDVIGTLLKWASPVMIGIVGWLGLGYLQNIKGSLDEMKGEIKELKNKATNTEVREYKNDLRLEALEKRMDKLEQGKSTYKAIELPLFRHEENYHLV